MKCYREYVPPDRISVGNMSGFAKAECGCILYRPSRKQKIKVFIKSYQIELNSIGVSLQQNRSLKSKGYKMNLNASLDNGTGIGTH